MKTMFAILFLICAFGLNAQSDEKDIRKAVVSFFKAMGAKDTSAMATRFTEDAHFQTLPNGLEKMHITMISDFLFELGAFKDHTFKEDIYNLTIKSDMNLAMVWAPYTFYLNEKFSHCGVNLITLVKVEGNWLIQSIVDTRRKENCDKR